MAKNPANLQGRIRDAYIYHLMHLKPEELPEEIQDKFKEFCQKVKSGELLKMDSEELFLLANEIVHMADVIRAHHRH
jgi:hypothetical protein